MPRRVLIVTGSMLTATEPSLLDALRKQLSALRGASGAWLEVQAKLDIVERLIATKLERSSPRYRRAPHREAVERYFTPLGDLDGPELTEVSLASLLESAGLTFEAATYAELYSDADRREALLDRCDVVFASTTLLRDLSEVRPMMAMLKRPHNRVVAGGALTGLLHGKWPASEHIDLLAVGYGELLVPSLVAWIDSGFEELSPPAGGRIEQRGDLVILYSGVPASRDLDALPTPDWTIAERYHGRKLALVKYESVRGCPYRCSFCNYPFLFDDTRFRFRSATRIAEDWAELERNGAEWISCLDSLFTMPRRRLRELCRILIARKSRLEWICYARADDLADRAMTELMHDAGCVQVHIGIESGSQQILDNMNKVVTVESNHRALENCRSVGITSFATVILGFPGSTEDTAEETYRFLRETPPDICYPAAFNTRFEGVPVLDAENRARFDLVTAPVGNSGQPYWRHSTMSCTEVGAQLRLLNRRIMEERITLDGAIFFPNSLRFDPCDRNALLDFQHDVAANHAILRQAFDRAGDWVQRKLDRDVDRALSISR